MKIQMALLAIIPSLFLCCISDPGCGDPAEISEFNLIVTLVDSINCERLIGGPGTGGIYNAYETKVFLNDHLIDIEISSDLIFNNWPNIENREYGKIYEFDYTIDLVTYDYISNIDTLNIKYSLNQGKCGDEIDFIEIKYNDILRYSGGEHFFFTIKL